MAVEISGRRKCGKPFVPYYAKRFCSRCGTGVQPEKDRGLRKEYPYYCPKCDENMYSFECTESGRENVYI